MSFKNSILKACSSENSNETIYGMWIGEELSLIEQLSISSFLKNGHKYVLYTYDNVKNIPDNVEVRDGNEILNKSHLDDVEIEMPEAQRRSSFSDWFRYRMLYKNGGWWADLDIICLKPLDCDLPYAFSRITTLDYYKKQMVNNCIIKSPSRAPIFKSYDEICASRIKEGHWGELGPYSFSYLIKKHGLESFIYPLYYFEPSISTAAVFKNETATLPDAYTIHLLNNHLVNKKWDKNGTYPYNSLIEKLKRKYLEK